MKTIYFLVSMVVSIHAISQITYVDNFDGVYPFTTSSTVYNFDLNGDSYNDISLNYGSWTNSGQSCFNGTNSGPSCRFKGINNFYGQNLVNGNGQYLQGIDCVNDTLNVFDIWNAQSMIYVGYMPWNGYCFNIGVGSHKQGVRMIVTNPANGALGYKYAYIDYTLATNGDIIIHGWYYEDTFNVPIVANSQLDYPYDANCIHYDTVTVYDTVMVYDTTLIAVTDTLIINSNLNLPSPNDFNTIKVYPNPANDHITIDNGNYLIMQNHSIKIENSLGQQEFYSLINQQQFYIDITGWSGSGVYYLSLLDSQNIILTIRKIVIL